jgi:hypothetical protein
MNETIRRRLEHLISDNGSFQAGQQEERKRLQRVIDIRIDQLRSAPLPHVNAICTELLRIRQQLDQCH